MQFLAGFNPRFSISQIWILDFLNPDIAVRWCVTEMLGSHGNYRPDWLLEGDERVKE